RGLIPSLVLAELEQRSGRRVHELFDFVAGTSTGGILAAALTRPDPPPATEVVGLYEREGPEIFSRSLLKRITSADGNLDERYESTGLVAALRRHLGAHRLSEALVDVLITAYELEDRFAFLFRSSRARTDPAYDFALADAAHATSAAPTYFEPVRVRDAAGARSYALVDGGVYATNPSMVAIAELGHERIDLLLSLGTGSLTRPLPFEQARGWGRLEWASRIVDVVFDGVADTVGFEAGQLLGDRYVRLQTQLDDASDDLDDASAANLAALRREAERLIARESATLDRVVAALSA
ncbi:MAG: patatin-like phospholipase family protein, partial [Solirubrobacterales bacterium]|nr:patatin-like phospholipase family protein [Solirubrobacterales bacterium]